MNPTKRLAALFPKTVVAIILLLTALAVAAAMPAKAWAADGYNLYLAGVQITDDSPADVFGDGTVLYDASTRTLTLENYVATGVMGADTTGDSAASYEGMTGAADVADWGEAGMGWCFHNGIIGGIGGVDLAPGGGATRAMMTKMVTKVVRDVIG